MSFLRIATLSQKAFANVPRRLSRLFASHTMYKHNIEHGMPENSRNALGYQTIVETPVSCSGETSLHFQTGCAAVGTVCRRIL